MTRLALRSEEKHSALFNGQTDRSEIQIGEIVSVEGRQFVAIRVHSGTDGVNGNPYIIVHANELLDPADHIEDTIQMIDAVVGWDGESDRPKAGAA